MELKFILESILFTAQRPLSPKEMKDLLATAAEQTEDTAVRAFKKIPLEDISQSLEELVRDHEAAQRSYRLACVAGLWQFVSQPEYAPWIKALVGHKARPPRLSQPGLETLAIIAYRQPVTRAEVEQVRGVAVDGVVATLLERGLIEQVGRAEVPGRPMTYGTTAQFLEYFGLRGLEELPQADELRRLPVQKPESLLTVEGGQTPEQLPLEQTKPVVAQPAASEAPAAPEASDPSPTSAAPEPEPPAPTGDPEPKQAP